MATGPKLSLTGRALRLLSGREHSRAELQRKLAPHEETPGELAAVLDKLAPASARKCIPKAWNPKPWPRP